VSKIEALLKGWKVRRIMRTKEVKERRSQIKKY
jgi:hypothetical protein